MQKIHPTGKLAFTVSWQVQPQHAEAAAAIVARFAPLARAEPGLDLLVVARGTADPLHFLFFEIFRDQAAFDAHQETEHFRTLILRDALPLLSSRARVEYAPL